MQNMQSFFQDRKFEPQTLEARKPVGQSGPALPATAAWRQDQRGAAEAAAGRGGRAPHEDRPGPEGGASPHLPVSLFSL